MGTVSASPIVFRGEESAQVSVAWGVDPTHRVKYFTAGPAVCLARLSST